MDEYAETYSPEFYREHEAKARYYAVFARSVYHVIRPRSAVDFGCGNAYVLDELFRLGVRQIRGYDGSPHSISHAPARIQGSISIIDLAQPLPAGERYDLVISTEVAEHLPESAADTFVDNMCSRAEEWIVFTAAHPGQGGVNHVNCQPKSYWREKFAARGFPVAPLAERLLHTGIAALEWGPWWLRANLQVFSRSEKRPRGGYLYGPAKWIGWKAWKPFAKIRTLISPETGDT